MSMLTLLVALIGLPLAAISIILGLKYRARIQLTYVHQGYLPLFKSIVKTIEGIEILYKKKAIDPSLYLLTGSFVNTGNLDIDRSAIHDRLSINLPPAYKWLQAKITKSPSGVNADYKIRSDSTLEFKWGLLKTSEAFSFNALIKAPKGKIKSAEKLMSFSHRITNLQSLRKEGLPDYLPNRRKQRVISFFYTYIIIVGVVILLMEVWTPRERLNYYIEDSNKETFQASISVRANGLLKMKDDNGMFSDEVRPEDFSSKYKISDLGTIAQSPWVTQSMRLIAILMVFFGTQGLLFDYLKRRRLGKLRRIMKA